MAGSVIVITSGKGGVGKTTTSANIGTAVLLTYIITKHTTQYCV